MENNIDPELRTLQALREKTRGYFRVTARPAESYEKTFSVDFKNFSKGSYILDIGSGFNQELAKWFSSNRPDITVFSIDPSLYLRNPYEYRKVGIAYSIPDPTSKKEMKTATQEDIEERIRNVSPNTIVAVAPEFPFKNESFDCILDNHSAYMYLDKSERLRYLEEIIRILKSGGNAFIYPLDNYEDALNPNRVIQSKEEFETLMQNLSRNNPDVKFEIFEFDEGDESKPNKRYGVKIIKQ